MDTPPVLLLGFNRPQKLSQLISALRVNRPELVLLAVDGPRSENKLDFELVKQTQAVVEQIDWPATIQTRFREENLGLKNAVTDAVNWATSTFGRVIVIEDDCVPGPHFLPFAAQMLERFENNQEIAHINGYNLVDKRFIKDPSCIARLTRYPESYAWATWERSWRFYDDELTWATNCSVSDLQKITKSFWGAVRWKINFSDAASGRINTWAYRWLASMWSRNLSIVAPNQNLVRYDGHDIGTHVRRSAHWQELELGEPNLNENSTFDFPCSQDEFADKWLGRKVFRESFLGTCEGVAASLAMGLLEKKSEFRNKKLKTT